MTVPLHHMTIGSDRAKWDSEAVIIYLLAEQHHKLLKLGLLDPHLWRDFPNAGLDPAKAWRFQKIILITLRNDNVSIYQTSRDFLSLCVSTKQMVTGGIYVDSDVDKVANK